MNGFRHIHLIRTMYRIIVTLMTQIMALIGALVYLTHNLAINALPLSESINFCNESTVFVE